MGRCVIGRQNDQPPAIDISARNLRIEKNCVIGARFEVSIRLSGRACRIDDVALSIEDVGDESEDDDVAFRD